MKVCLSRYAHITFPLATVGVPQVLCEDKLEKHYSQIPFKHWDPDSQLLASAEKKSTSGLSLASATSVISRIDQISEKGTSAPSWLLPTFPIPSIYQLWESSWLGRGLCCSCQLSTWKEIFQVQSGTKCAQWTRESGPETSHGHMLLLWTSPWSWFAFLRQVQLTDSRNP